MSRRRVAITGIGAVSSLGLGVEPFWRAILAARPGIAPIGSVDRSLLRFEYGAEAREFDPLDHLEPRRADQIDRFAQLGLVAAREAIRGSGLGITDQSRSRVAVVTGSCIGGEYAHEQVYVDLFKENRGRVHPLTVPRVMANAGASHIAMEFGFTGPAFTVASACASSGHAIGQAFWMVRDGMVDAAVAGGSEAPFTLGNLKAWEGLRVIAPDTCRPFAKDRRGLILGEGAAMLVLEPLDAARARGATILAELAGCGMSSDAGHLTMPSAEGAAAAMRGALADAGIGQEQVGYVNAHGTGTRANDVTEARAIRAVFDGRADRLAVSSTKSMHGHALGAASALEAVATALALRDQVFPPTANFTERDPECDLDVIPNAARAGAFEYALSNSFAFGGLNAVLAFRRCDAR
ncbi:MAG TPA: beta-ketoacyl-[acyl-carrier-protein] synthase family protein [Isosphaeraceae bacterium]